MGKEVAKRTPRTREDQSMQERAVKSRELY